MIFSINEAALAELIGLKEFSIRPENVTDEEGLLLRITIPQFLWAAELQQGKFKGFTHPADPTWAQHQGQIIVAGYHAKEWHRGQNEDVSHRNYGKLPYGDVWRYAIQTIPIREDRITRKVKKYDIMSFQEFEDPIRSTLTAFDLTSTEENGYGQSYDDERISFTIPLIIRTKTLFCSLYINDAQFGEHPSFELLLRTLIQHTRFLASEIGDPELISFVEYT